MQNAVGTRNVETKTKVFISYSRKDMAFADRLEAALRLRGFEPLIDRREILALEEWWKRVEALIVRADTMVFVLSPDAVASDVARREVSFAASLNKRLAPIVFRSVDDKSVPPELAKLNFILFDDASRFERNVDKLAEALNTDIDWIRQHTEYGEAERRWSAAGRPGGLLLHSPTLEVAEHWIVSRPRNAPEPTKEIQAFIITSREGVRVAQRRRRLARALTYTLLIGIILGLVAWINQSFIADEWTWYTSVRPFLAANVWPYALKPDAETALKPGKSFRECAVRSTGKDYCPDMIVLPAGSFWMGARPSENQPLEHPQHKVTIAKPFAVSKYELTFDEWDACATYGDCAKDISDGTFGRGQRPVLNVTWDEAQTYVKWLSKITGKSYRLLSEAEYEYAARAETQTAYPWGNDIKLDGKAMANCFRCGSKWDNKQTAPVGSFDANGFGLYDMVGNVAAWTQDCVHENYNGAPTDGSAWLIGGNCDGHIIRGSSWHSTADEVRSAMRDGSASTQRTVSAGFRIAQTLVAP